jgi:VanZ family protein
LPDPALRFLRLWQAIGVLLIGFVVYLSLTPHPIEVPVKHGDKYGHVLAYATLMFWFAQIYLGRHARIGWAIGFVAMGVGLEFLQRLTDYRTFEIADMIADACGVIIALKWGQVRFPQIRDASHRKSGNKSSLPPWSTAAHYVHAATEHGSVNGPCSLRQSALNEHGRRMPLLASRINRPND